MSDYYLGNGNKRPKLADYKREFGWNGGMYYTIDKLRYEQKVRDRKQLKETNKKASEYEVVYLGVFCHLLKVLKGEESNGRIYK